MQRALTIEMDGSIRNASWTGISTEFILELEFKHQVRVSLKSNKGGASSIIMLWRGITVKKYY